MEAYQFRFYDVVVEMPWWWFDAMLVWLGIMGLLLWLFGRKLIRPLFGAVGLAIGAAVTLALLERYLPSARPMPWMIGGAVLGALLLGGLMWRIALALVLTAVLAILVPWGVLLATGMQGPPIWEPVAGASSEMRQAVHASVTAGGDADTILDPDADPETDVVAGGGAGADHPPSVTEPIHAAVDQVAQSLDSWWAALEVPQRYWLIGAAVGGGLVAMLIGLALPNLSASLITALLGVAMMLGIVQRLVTMLPQATAEAIAMPPRILALAILIATLLGAIVQWLIFRRAAD